MEERKNTSQQGWLCKQNKAQKNIKKQKNAHSKTLTQIYSRTWIYWYIDPINISTGQL